MSRLWDRSAGFFLWKGDKVWKQSMQQPWLKWDIPGMFEATQE